MSTPIGRRIAVRLVEMFGPRIRSQRGFTLIDIMAVVTVIGIISAITVPMLTGSIDRMRLGQSARNVEREMQVAKSRAVGKGRPIRIRFDCPAAGQFRVTEVIGTTTVPTAQDAAANRCDPAVYPFPAADANPLTLPNLDGPVRSVDASVTFAASQTIEFWPDGTAHHDTGGGSPWPLIPVAGINISLTRNGETSTITVNGLGKIQLQSQ